MADMALYNTPWGQRELPDDEAAQLRGQVGPDAITEAPAEDPPVADKTKPGVTVFEGTNSKPEGK